MFLRSPLLPAYLSCIPSRGVYPEDTTVFVIYYPHARYLGFISWIGPHRYRPPGLCVARPRMHDARCSQQHTHGGRCSVRKSCSLTKAPRYLLYFFLFFFARVSSLKAKTNITQDPGGDSRWAPHSGREDTTRRTGTEAEGGVSTYTIQ